MVSITAAESRLGQHLGLRAASSDVLNENKDEGLEEMRKPMTDSINDVEKRSTSVLGWADAAELGIITSLSFILFCKAIDDFEFMLT